MQETGKPNMRLAPLKMGVGGVARWGWFATGPYLPHAFTRQRWESRARRVSNPPAPFPGCAHFRITLPNLRGGKGNPKF